MFSQSVEPKSIRALKLAFMMGVAVASIAPAIARDAPAASDDNAGKPQSASSDIIVTANRREQRLQDVGVSVTALGAESLRNLSIKDSQDIVRAVPALKLNAFSTSAVVYNIRGVSQNDYGDQQEPPVAVYQDDSYASSLNLSGFPVFDLERVEVLRGPQGTLFGRNATGGAMQFVSKKPTKDFEATASVTYGSYNQLITEAAISGPVTDNLQARVAGIRNRSDGYIKSIVAGGHDQGGNDSYAFRGFLAWQPSSNVDVLLKMQYARNDHERQAGQYSWSATKLNADGQGVYLPATEDFWGTGPGADLGGYRNDAIDPQRGGNPYLTAANNHDSYVDRTLYATTLRVDADLGSLRLTSISGYQYGRKFYHEDADASPVDQIDFYTGSKIRQYSQEVRLAGKFANHEVTVGAFGMKVDGSYFGSFSLPLFNYFPLANFTQKTTSYAFFAQDEWAITDKVKLIGGARYWHDRRKADYTASDNLGVNVIFNNSEIFPATPGVSPSDADRNFSGYALRAEFDYKPSNNLLLYTSYNRGSKSGGFTLSVGTPAAGNEQTFIQGLSYRPETLHSFEAGAKTTIAPGTTLNLAAFYYIYKNYQAYAQFGTVQTVVNLDARAKGLEVELASNPLEGLTVQLGASFLDTNVKDVPLPSGRLTDRNLPQAAGASGNWLVRYERPVGPGSISVQTDGLFTSKFCFSVLCAPVEQEKGYAVVNGRIGFASNSGWDLAFFVNNITKTQYRVYGVDGTAVAGLVNSIYGKPRTWGITASIALGGARR